MNKSSCITVKPAKTPLNTDGLTYHGTVVVNQELVRKVAIGKGGIKVRSFVAQLNRLNSMIASLQGGQEKADRLSERTKLLTGMGEEVRALYQPRVLASLADDKLCLRTPGSTYAQVELVDGKVCVSMYSAPGERTQITVETTEGVYDVLAGEGVPERLEAAMIGSDGKSDLVKSPPVDQVFEARPAQKSFNSPRLSQAKRSNK